MEVAVLELFLMNKEELVGDVLIEGIHDYSYCETVLFEIKRQEKSWNYSHELLEQISACLGLCLVRSHGTLAWKAKWHQSKDNVLKGQNGSFWHAEIWAGEAEGQHGWTGNAWLSSDAERKCMEGGGKDRPPGRITEIFLVCAGSEIRKPKLSRSWHSQEMLRARRQAYRSLLVAEGRLRELCAHCSVGRGPGDDGHWESWGTQWIFLKVSQAPELTFRLCGSETEGRVRDHLTQLGPHKSMAPGGLQLQMLMELPDVCARLYFITFKRPWQGSRFQMPGKRQTLRLSSENTKGDCGKTAFQVVSPHFLGKLGS